MPTNREIGELSKICEEPPITLLKRNKNFGEVDLAHLMAKSSRNSYDAEDVS